MAEEISVKADEISKNSLNNYNDSLLEGSPTDLSVSNDQSNEVQSNEQKPSVSKESNNAVEASSSNSSDAGPSKEEDEWLDILGSGHLKKKILVKGLEDSRPHRGDSVILDIIGKLEDGTEFEKIENIEICIGDAEVVQGIEYALPLMETGETAHIIVSPRFGYGSLGDLPRVPKDATLNYIVTIKNVIEIKDINEFSFEDRLRIGLMKKDRGNWWYQRKEYNLAIQCYRKALQFFEQEVKDSDETLTEAVIKTYNNLSVAHFNLEAFDSALTSVNKVLKHEPNNIKAVYRKVKILKAQGETDEAISVARKGLKAKPDSPALQDELKILLEIKKKSTLAQKDLYKKMFKTTESEDKKDSSGKKTLMSHSWKIVGILTVAVGVIGAVAIKFKY